MAKNINKILERLQFNLSQLNLEIIGIFLLVLGFGLIGADINIDIWEKNLSSYSEVKGDSITSETGISISLDEVVLLEDEIIIYTTLNKAENDIVLYNWQTLYINGKKVEDRSSGMYDQVNNLNQQAIFRCKLDSETNLQEDIKIKYVIEGLKYVNSENEIKVISGEWSWEFMAKISELKLETKIIDIDKNFILHSGQEVILNYLSNTNINSKLHFTINNTSEDIGFIKFKIVDDKGNELNNVYSGHFDGEKGYYTFDPIDLKNTSYVTIIPYSIQDDVYINRRFIIKL
ncbi:hypothetical protein AN639_02035 [Candidatus Epulonipiscium fishelsonii]|uniref:Uncharacterized protein n=1 Tax=Candidatus Epulonipiscium fishelsonii TaxID=77094 RepID=A0ACC8XG32_9FIRM|nr:hypothetical protein AN396_02170 [Epulopiscium sp. SCG-B11WGA-EpuloA1]ONI43854.1 hypothetical protein AN639_02035 [Epulopiscium sp. SCG-B05WGA-EpuloA1]